MTTSEVARLAEELAAVGRVASLVVADAPPAAVFESVTAQVGQLIGADAAAMVRVETDSEVTCVGYWTKDGGYQAVYSGVEGTVGDFMREQGWRASVDAPVVLEGRTWGVLAVASSTENVLPEDTEARVAKFAELVGTAVSNAKRGEDLAVLVQEQASLRRVATLVAGGASPAEVFEAVTREAAQVLDTEAIGLLRLEPHGSATLVAQSQTPWDPPPLGTSFTLEGQNVIAEVLRTGQTTRFDSWADSTGSVAAMAQAFGIRSSVAAPIVVQGRLWGAMIAATTASERLPSSTESRIGEFTELVATAIANTESRSEVQRLADEQAGLRRVATLVAGGAAPTEVFEAVVDEVGQLLGAAQVGLARYERDHEITVLAIRGQDPSALRAGMRLPLDGDSVNARILRTGRSARVNFAAEGSGTIAQVLRHDDVNATVGAPITVEGALWGMIGASWRGQDPPPADAEERLAQFAELLDMAIANADSRDQLIASRARVLTEGDEARRRVVRDLHDGAQQRLVHAIVTLKLAQRALREDPGRTDSLLAEALAHAERGNAELRELSHGILPSVLTRGGLRAGIDAVVSRLELPVDLNVTGERVSPEIEASAYFIVLEALTNVVKHSRATRAEVTVALGGDRLSVEVRDNGIGGADPRGHGLVGISDRAAAFGGWLRVDSSPGEGTEIAAELPLPA